MGKFLHRRLGARVHARIFDAFPAGVNGVAPALVIRFDEERLGFALVCIVVLAPHERRRPIRVVAERLIINRGGGGTIAWSRDQTPRDSSCNRMKLAEPDWVSDSTKGGRCKNRTAADRSRNGLRPVRAR